MKRKHDFEIGPEGNPYMLRWYLIPRNPVFNVYYHRMLHDDDDRALHDHPWWSLSFRVRGTIKEIYLRRGRERSRIIPKWRPVFRSGRFAHRLVLPDGPAETIFITGPRFRVWGFHCPQGWRPWHEFVKRTNTGSIGRGCGD